MQEIFSTFPTEPLKAIQELPRHTLMLYIHSYQSFLWNSVVLAGCTGRVPLLGFGTEFDEYKKKIEEEYARIMQQEGITQRDFIIKQLQNISPEGDERESHITVQVSYDAAEDDELHSGKKKQTVKFSLPKGSYATVVVDALCT